MSYLKKSQSPFKVPYSSTPATPESNFGVIYFDSVTQLPKYKNAAGSTDFVGTPSFPMNATAGSAAAPSIYFGDSDTGFYASAADNIDFTVAGGQIANFTSSNFRFKTIGTGGKLYLHNTSTAVYLKSSASVDLEVVADTVYIGKTAVTPLWVDGDNIHVWKSMIFRTDNTLNFGENGGGTFFRPQYAHIGTGIRVGGTGAALGTSEIAAFVSTTKGVVFPNATEAGVTTPTTGMVIFDTGTSKLKVYTGAAWETITSA